MEKRKELVLVFLFSALCVATLWEASSHLLSALLAGGFMAATIIYVRTKTSGSIDFTALLLGMMVLYVLYKVAVISPLAFKPAILAASFAAGLFCEGCFKKAKMHTKVLAMFIIFFVFLIGMQYPISGKDLPGLVIVFCWGIYTTLGSPALVNALLTVHKPN